eukprot:TRINITY_DN13924_c0_g1_i1.p1 TRINITY_DN13924_c0_g1~~TRINITY_DN13924_c0_g1_i1.p1  ORF type:complete len:266 (+),score=59.48 TRINITY_DN13924_c0_g1_i1:77-799(+)
MGKIGHTIVGVLSIVAVVFCACALTDGRSIVTLRTDHKEIPVTLSGAGTNLPIQGLPGIGYPYGIGVYQDSNGRKWEDGSGFAELSLDTTQTELTRRSSHVTNLYGCDDHQKRGQLVLACVFICLIVSSAAVIASLRGVATESRGAGIASLVFQILNFIFFLIGMAGGASLFNEEFECKSGDVIVFDLKLADYFDLNYALPFLVIGVVASIINIIVIVASGSLSDPESSKNAPDSSSDSS